MSLSIHSIAVDDKTLSSVTDTTLENSSISIIKAFNIFVIIYIYWNFCFSHVFIVRVSRGRWELVDGSDGELFYPYLSIFIFHFFPPFVWETHFSNWFQLNFSLSHTHDSAVYRHRQFVVAVVGAVFHIISEKKRIQDDGVTCIDIMWQSL